MGRIGGVTDITYPIGAGATVSHRDDDRRAVPVDRSITYPEGAAHTCVTGDLDQRPSKTDSADATNTVYDGAAVPADSGVDCTQGGLTDPISARASGTSKYPTPGRTFQHCGSRVDESERNERKELGAGKTSGCRPDFLPLR